MNIATIKNKLLTIGKWSLLLGAVTAVVVLAVVTRNQWLPAAKNLLSPPPKSSKKTEDHSSHEGHDHAGHDEGNSLELSPQGRKNIDLKTAAIKLQTFTRTVSIPAIIVGRMGRSQIDVTASLGGRVTRVYPIEGEAVEPGQPLFDLRLTHEELVRAQSEFLRSAEELDVVLREIKRLESVSLSGAIPGKRLLEREYEKQKTEAAINAQKQSLLLHGLTLKQVNDILQKRTLVQGVTIYAPEHPQNGTPEYDATKNGKPAKHQHPFTVSKLHVKPGQYVDAGAPLCLLTDYSELYIEGRAFEQDADELLRTTRESWSINATTEGNNKQPDVIEKLKIVYIDNKVDPVSRALHFYVGLANKTLLSEKTVDGHRFLTWKYRLGQRMQLQVPVERWEKRIVLPVDAVANEGVEYYVFQQNGDHFDRVPVQVEYQDQFWTVIANDGSVFPGDIVAVSGASRMQTALKNKSGGAVDPHAGHNH